MTQPAIDQATFEELQQTAGAEFVRELVDTFLAEAPLMLASLDRALAARDADRFPPRRAFAQVQQQHVRCAGAGRAGARSGTVRASNPCSRPMSRSSMRCASNTRASRRR